MAYKKTHRKKYKNAYNSSEKKAYKRGFLPDCFYLKKINQRQNDLQIKTAVNEN